MTDKTGDLTGAWTPAPHIPKITARPVTPEIEAAATARARQAAVDSERAAAWIAAHSGPTVAEATLARVRQLAHDEQANGGAIWPDDLLAILDQQS